mmetsp:Transcript_57850/g.125850  ORF Transcript_57850/g.125850 Transcript_57850/m.125850 type:complete len:221 (+) Transcript_57850:271-933(+)
MVRVPRVPPQTGVEDERLVLLGHVASELCVGHLGEYNSRETDDGCYDIENVEGETSGHGSLLEGCGESHEHRMLRNRHREELSDDPQSPVSCSELSVTPVLSSSEDPTFAAQVVLHEASGPNANESQRDGSSWVARLGVRVPEEGDAEGDDLPVGVNEPGGSLHQVDDVEPNVDNHKIHQIHQEMRMVLIDLACNTPFGREEDLCRVLQQTIQPIERKGR